MAAAGGGAAAASPRHADPNAAPRRRAQSGGTCVADPALQLHALRFAASPVLARARRVCVAWRELLDSATWLWEATLAAEHRGLPGRWVSAAGRFGAQHRRAAALHRLSRFDDAAVVTDVEDPTGFEPQDREGHAMALDDESGLLVLWSGFCSDPYVNWRRLPANLADLWNLQHGRSAMLEVRQQAKWRRERPRLDPADAGGSEPGLRYGHRLVPLPGTRAGAGPTFLITGGGTQGGYRGMIWDPWLLLTDDVDDLKNKPAWTPGFRWERQPGDQLPGEARAYHGCCVDAAAGAVWITGGVAEGDCVATTARWTRRADGGWYGGEVTAARFRNGGGGGSPRLRWGHSSAVTAGHLYICGGYTGRGMLALYDGQDLEGDVWCFPTQSVHLGDTAVGWRRVNLRPAPAPAVLTSAVTGRRRRLMGRCHAMAPVADGVFAFTCGGSEPVGDVCVVDVRGGDAASAVLRVEGSRTARLAVRGGKMEPRLAHQMVARGGALLLWGGWSPNGEHTTTVVDFDCLPDLPRAFD